MSTPADLSKPTEEMTEKTGQNDASTDEEWTMLQMDWQTQDATFGALQDETAAADRKQRRGVLIEVLASVSLVAFWALRMGDGASMGTRLLGWGSIAFVVFWMASLLANYRGTWRADAETCDAFLDLSRRRIRANQRWTQWVYGYVAVFGTGFAAWCAWAWWRTDTYAARPGALVIAIAGFYGILGGVVWWNRRSRRRLDRELAALDAALIEPAQSSS